MAVYIPLPTILLVIVVAILAFLRGLLSFMIQKLLSRFAIIWIEVLFLRVSQVVTAVVLRVRALPHIRLWRNVAAFASGQPMVLLRSVLLEFVDMLLVVVFGVLVEVARRVRVVIPAVHSE